MFLTDRKLERRIEEIEQYRYRDIIELKSFAAMEETDLLWIRRRRRRREPRHAGVPQKARQDSGPS